MAPSRRVEDAKEWLEARLRTWVSQARGQARGEADPSGHDVVKLHEQGRYGEAEVAARRLVESVRERRGERHPHYATALSNLALSLQKQGDYTGAEPLLRQALDIRRETLGERHPHYATALNNLALLLCEQGDLAAAEPLMRQALDIRREAVGERHPDHATGLTSLAMLLCERGDLASAEPLLRQALDIRRETLGERHPHYATALTNLALLLRERGDLAGAEPLLRQSLNVRRTTLGDDHPDTRACAHALESLPPAAIPEPETAAAAVPGERAVEVRDASALRDEANALSERLARVGEQMAEAAERMRSNAVPPDEQVLHDAAACRRDFIEFRAQVLHLAESVGVSERAPAEAGGLPELSALLEAAAERETLVRSHEEVKRRALELARQVLALTTRDDRYRPILEDIQSQAEEIRHAIAESPAQALPAEVEQFAAGEHPLAALVHLARGAHDLDDARWADLLESVSAAFGRPVAIAVARGKFFESPR